VARSLIIEARETSKCPEIELKICKNPRYFNTASAGTYSYHTVSKGRKHKQSCGAVQAMLRFQMFGRTSNTGERKGHPMTYLSWQREEVQSIRNLARDGWSAPRSGRFTPRKDPVNITQEAGWASEPVWTGAENPVPYGD
jgi:hypothetical protein